MPNTKEAMSIAVEIGDQMLRNGAEIYRVEDTVLHILKAYDVEECDVYVVSNGIFASANEHTDDACSMIRHVPLGATNLGKISALNQLTRDICSDNCSIEGAWKQLELCKQIKGYSTNITGFFSGLGSGGFCFLFGGKPLDTVFAFIIGLIEHYLLMTFSKYKVSKFIANLFASLFVTAMSFLVVFLELPVQQDKIIIGALMPLVPGIAFTTSIRDFYNEDYLSGTIHIVDALLNAACIAIGACLPLFFYKHMGGAL